MNESANALFFLIIVKYNMESCCIFLILFFLSASSPRALLSNAEKQNKKISREVGHRFDSFVLNQNIASFIYAPEMPARQRLVFLPCY